MRGHNIIFGDLRSPNNKILQMHVVAFGRLKSLVKFQSHHSKTADPSEGKS